MKASTSLFILLLSLMMACSHSKDIICETEIHAPVGIVMGASVAEGVPALRGRHRGQCDNEPGQISYYLEQETGIRVLNQGIGGQSCGQVLSRWSTDVDAYNVQYVWLNCGHNDFRLESDPIASIKKYTLKAIQKAKAGGYKIYIQNLGYNYHKPKRNASIDQINAWYQTLADQDVIIVDYFTWASSNQNLLVDGLHPSKTGFKSFMTYAEGFL